MSARLNIWTAIKNKIEADVTSVKTVELWNQQISDTNEQAFAYPALFVEFTEVDWNQTRLQPTRNDSKAGAEQRGDAIISIHICFEEYRNVNDSFVVINTILDDVYYALQGLQATDCQPMLRTSERQDVDHDNVIHWVFDFKLGMAERGLDMVDSGDLTSKTGVTPDITVTPDIDNDIIRTGDGE